MGAIEGQTPATKVFFTRLNHIRSGKNNSHKTENTAKHNKKYRKTSEKLQAKKPTQDSNTGGGRAVGGLGGRQVWVDE